MGCALRLLPRLCPAPVSHHIQYHIVRNMEMTAVNAGAAIFSGRAEITLNQGQITPFGPGVSGCFYGAFHHRQSRRLCEVSPHGVWPGNIATPNAGMAGNKAAYPLAHRTHCGGCDLAREDSLFQARQSLGVNACFIRTAAYRTALTGNPLEFVHGIMTQSR